MRFYHLAILTAFAAGACATAPRPLTTAADCRTGAWRLEDGRLIDVGPGRDGYRWRTISGEINLLTGSVEAPTSTRGATGRSDGHSLRFDCSRGRLTFDGVVGRKLTFDVIETKFSSGGQTLFGHLVLPSTSAAVPVVVEVQGSGREAYTEVDARQRILPAEGLGVFVYDKRGTGRSTGHYTQNFSVLAADAAAAAREARRLAGPRMSYLIYEGSSQGGWVAPLAATLEPPARVIVGFGLTVSPLEENKSQVIQELTEKGYGPEDIAAATEIADATGELIASDFRSGFDKYGAVRTKYRREPWFREIRGEFTGELLAYPAWVLRLAAPLARSRSVGTPWRYEPLPALRTLDTRVLWVLAGADRDAPPAQTRKDLQQLQANGQKITVLEFPDTDHGIITFEEHPNGARTMTGVADGYIQAVIDFAKEGQLKPDTAYGQSKRWDPSVR